MSLDTSEQFDVLNDTGIELDMSDAIPNVPLSSNDNVEDAVPDDIEKQTLDDKYDDEPEPRIIARRKTPKKGRVVRDINISLTSYVMRTRTTNTLISTKGSDIAVLQHRRSAEELFRTPAHRGSINQLVMDQVFNPRLVQQIQPDYDMLDTILGPGAAREVRGESDRVLRRSVRNRPSTDMSLNMSSLDLVDANTTLEQPSSPGIQGNIGETSSLPPPEIDEPIIMDHNDGFDIVDHETVHRPLLVQQTHRVANDVISRNGPSNAMGLAGAMTADTQILQKLEALWTKNERPVRMEDLLQPGCNRVVAAKTFNVLLGKL